MKTNQQAQNSHFGFVAVMDVLGFRELSLGKEQDYLEQMNEYISDCCYIKKANITAFSSMLEISPRFDGLKHNIYILGDTIIFTVSVLERDKIFALQRSLSYVLSQFVVLGIERGIFIRGAVSLGDYYISKNKRTIIGPAINDVMDWNEAADWMGIVLTPFTSFHFEKSKNNPPEEAPITFRKTTVQLSPRTQMGTSRQLWALTWPCNYHRYFMDKNQREWTENNIKESWNIARDNLLDKLCLKNPIPARAAGKYNNTLAYFDSMKEQSIKNAIDLMELVRTIQPVIRPAASSRPKKHD